jgi:type II secretory pathway component PulF
LLSDFNKTSGTKRASLTERDKFFSKDNFQGIFTRQLANLRLAGLPLSKSLAAVVEQTENLKLREVIKDLRSRVEDGSSFSTALAEYPKLFPSFYTSMVHAGEAGGMLDKVLERLASFAEKEQELKGNLKSAMAYPALLALVGVATIFFLTTFIIPRFITMFQDLGQVLPLPTRVLISMSTFTSNYWWLIISGVLLIIFIMNRYYHTEQGRVNIDRFRLRLPAFGSLSRRIEISKFSHGLGTLLQNGVPILNALGIVSHTINNQIIAREVIRFREGVAKGEMLAEQIRDSGEFPSMVSNLLAIGERSGKLDSVLIRIANTLDKEIDNNMKIINSLIEPAMILILGGIVGFLVISMLLPIFRINVLIK